MRLEQRDSTLQRFDARVEALRDDDGAAWVRLDVSAFYPTSGGQPADRGTLEGAAGAAAVEDVRLDGGAVWHRLDRAPFGVGDAVRGEIDWPRRLWHMRRHSGQHLLSQAFVRLDPAFETRSVGLRSPTCTLDLDGEPDVEALRGAETLVNEVAARNLPIRAFEIDEGELARYPLRRPPKVAGRIRLVEMGDFERSACGGTHLRATAEALPIKVVSRERIRGGLTRIGFRVGAEALDDYRTKHTIVSALAASFSSRVEELPERIEALRDELARTRRALNDELQRGVSVEAQGLLAGAEALTEGRLVTARLADGRDPLPLAKALIAHPGVVALLAGEAGGRGRLLFARSDDLDLDVRPLLTSALEAIGGRGGGRPELAQGAGASDGLADALALAADALRRAR